jgi:hypothetical protein
MHAHHTATVRALRALRHLATIGCLVGAASAAQAQTAPTAAASSAPALEARAERITVEDGGSRIEELRVSGQTRRIEVQSKTGVPGYQVQPLQEQAPGTTGGAGTGTAGQGKSSWRVLKF